MSFLASVADISMWLFGLILMVSQLIAHAIGFQLGARQRKRQDSNPESVGAVVGGMLGLLAFVLALTLSFANERFSERRAGTLAESNAIGTAWLRATAVGGPHGEQIARLLDQYIVERADFVRAGRDIGKIDAINQRSNALQSRMWSEVTAIVREQPNPVSVSLMASVNDAFDAASVERFAFSLRMAPEMFWLLMALTLVSMAGLGYQLGVRGKAPRMLVLLLTVMWTAVTVVILDLASARLGGIRTDASAYEWTRQSFASPASPSAASR
jgi:hypothetical protein